MYWQTSRYQIDLTRPKVMGIVNVTPDSFSDGGQHGSTLAALRHCEQLIRDGADILDVGGESTRPGAPPVSLEDELGRVLPVLREAVRLGVPLSLDSYKPRVMQAGLDLGVDIINDIWALRQHDEGEGDQTLGASEIVAAHPNCGVCLMHMHREPQTMQVAPMQGDVVAQVRAFLEQLAHDLQALGVGKSRIMLDPGIGFGKTVAQNFSLLARQAELLQAGYPVLAGWSRKSSLAGMVAPTAPHLAGEPASERLALVGSYLYALPDQLPDLVGLRFLHPGWWLGTLKPGRFEPSHALALGLTVPEAGRVFDLPVDSPDLGSYLRGEMFASPGEDGWTLVAVDGFPIGWGKRAGGQLKSHYPKGLRRP